MSEIRKRLTNEDIRSAARATGRAELFVALVEGVQIIAADVDVYPEDVKFVTHHVRCDAFGVLWMRLSNRGRIRLREMAEKNHGDCDPVT